MSRDIKKYHFMVCGTIIFEHDDGLQQSTLNAVVTNSENKIPARLLGKAQQGLQANLHTQIGTIVTVKNVIINSIVPLGLMSDEEFAAPPKGTKLEEIAIGEVIPS